MNKILLILLLICALSSYAQDSCTIVSKIDQFTNQKVSSLGAFMFKQDKGEMWVIADRTVRSYTITFMFFSRDDIICFKENSTATVLFIDGTKANIIHNDDLNCKGTFSFTARIAKGIFLSFQSVVPSLCRKPIKAIRFYSTEGYIDAEITNGYDGDSEMNIKLMKGLNCLKQTY